MTWPSLVSDLVGSPVSADMVESVAAATEGNPFFAEEMTLHLVDNGLLVKTDDGVVVQEQPGAGRGARAGPRDGRPAAAVAVG